MSDIISALSNLDVNNSNHWTADGLPRIDTVRMLAGDPSLDRASVEAAAPGFNRETATTWAPQPQAGEQQAPSTPQGAETAIAATMAPTAGDDAATALQNAAPGAPADPDAPAGPVVQSQMGDVTLQELVDEQTARVQGIRDAIAQAQDVLRRESAELDKLLIRQQEQGVPEKHNPTAIQNYLRSQRESLDARAAKKKMLAQSSLDLKELAAGLKSPLDASFKRR